MDDVAEEGSDGMDERDGRGKVDVEGEREFEVLASSSSPGRKEERCDGCVVVAVAALAFG